jgi:hypothetical protein
MLKHKKLFNRYNQKINKKFYLCCKKILKSKLKQLRLPLNQQQQHQQQHQQHQQQHQQRMQVPAQ